MLSFTLAVIAVLGHAAGATAQTPTCSIAAALQALPTDIRETSGLIRGRVNPDVFWTHNDSGNQPEIFAIAPDGSIKARVRVGHARVTDWEDVDAAPCRDGHCLYIGDIGDNAGIRSNVTIYEVAEPKLPAADAAVIRAINARYSDGPQDAEAFFRAPNGEFYVVTKGRQKPIRLYKLVVAPTATEGILQPVREIAPRPRAEADRVTGATISPNGQWVAVRSYSTLYLYRFNDLIAPSGMPSVTFSLVPLGERQGESITLDDDGTLWLTSEAENKKDVPTIARVTCTLP